MVVNNFLLLACCVTITVSSTTTEGISNKNVVGEILVEEKEFLSNIHSRSTRQVECTAPLYQQTQFYYMPVPGEPGVPGLPGRNGEPGIAGVIGTTGYHGINGNHGNDGIPGPDGPIGMKGQKGDQGLDGLCGLPGSDGVPGIGGYTGEQGSIGPRGPQGPTGKPGVRGPPGLQGSIGRAGYAGKSGPQGLKGIPGTFSPTNVITTRYRAFSVALNSNVEADNGDKIIIWDHGFTNVGGDFDMETGTFNVTVPGTYFFTFHVCKTSRDTYPHVELVKNGESVVSAIDYGPSDTDDCSDNSVILTLRNSDVIWMVLNDEREISSSPYRFTTFSGFLIFPMPI